MPRLPESIAPILPVADMARSLRFYRDLLGMEPAEWGDDTFTHVAGDRCGIYLARNGNGAPASWVWVGVEDARALGERLRDAGVTILAEAHPQPWAIEVHVEDPDGHVLRLGSDPDADPET